ncbi:hypothetical protein BHE74_00048887 [Ensete ventricosum]|uniref:Uncharacterized protein n=1 Tax=Ensete ventricosum TaxID=4639 RepID=A0A426XD71_ENSVE|nr:hypothetical protein B296_00050792 [Ensete ventricosum]RWW45293.1 hypothetical protein BHE74_00048887 [Ensete ventricosum]
MKNNTVMNRLLHVCSSSSFDSEAEERGVVEASTWNDASGIVTCLSINTRTLLSKQFSTRDTQIEVKWEKRRRQILHRRRITVGSDGDGGGAKEEEQGGEGEEMRPSARTRSLTDEDLDELRGSIELGFGFNEEKGGHDLCDTLPALNLYFAVNREFSEPPKLQPLPSPDSTPVATSSWSTLCRIPRPPSPNEASQPGSTDSWKICNPGAAIFSSSLLLLCA